MPSKYYKDIDICPFTGEKIKIDKTYDIFEADKIMWFGYYNEILNYIVISHSDYIILKGKYLSKDRDYYNNLYIYKGIIRNFNEKYNIPYTIDSDLIDLNFDFDDIPKEFRQKVYYFLKHLYNNGGKEYKSFDYDCEKDYPLAYANDSEEFQRIIEFSIQKSFLKLESKLKYFADGSLVPTNFKLSIEGIEEIERELPVSPLWNLVKQDVFTGNSQIDDKISHAKKLFFKIDSSFDDKRSACETLSFVLEPLREKLAKYFSGKDISTFFEIVNNFDVRHNKERTKQLEMVEQLEWIFYSLLNTIITYYKILRSENTI